MRWLTLHVSLLVAIYSFSIDKVEACSCAPEHPQTKFCNSDFVAKIQVQKVPQMYEIENLYQVKVKKVFKRSPEFNFTLKNKLLTLSEDELCDVNLNLNMTYVVSVDVRYEKPYISMCNLVIPWVETTQRQRKGLRWLYREGCKCKIVYTSFQRKGTVFEKTGGKQCLWESEPGPLICQAKQGICMQDSGGCSWDPSASYKNCIMNHKRYREQHRTREA